MRKWEKNLMCQICGSDITKVCHETFRRNPLKNPQPVECPRCGFVSVVGLSGPGVSPLEEDKFEAPKGMPSMEDLLPEQKVSNPTRVTTFDIVRAHGKDGRWIDDTIHFTDGSEMLIDRTKAKRFQLSN